MAYFIDWVDKDPYIIENYKKITNKKMAKDLDLNYNTLCKRVEKLKVQGKIKLKEPEPRKELKELELGKKYKVKNRKGTGLFIGELIGENDRFYTFKGRWVENFLKIDFVTGEYKIEEVK